MATLVTDSRPTIIFVVDLRSRKVLLLYTRTFFPGPEFPSAQDFEVCRLYLQTEDPNCEKMRTETLNVERASNKNVDGRKMIPETRLTVFRL